LKVANSRDCRHSRATPPHVGRGCRHSRFKFAGRRVGPDRPLWSGCRTGAPQSALGLAAPLIAAWPVYFFVVSFTYDAFGPYPNYKSDWLSTIGASAVPIPVTALAAFVARRWGRPRPDQTPASLAQEEASTPRRLSPAAWWWATLRGAIAAWLSADPRR